MRRLVGVAAVAMLAAVAMGSTAWGQINVEPETPPSRHEQTLTSQSTAGNATLGNATTAALPVCFDSMGVWAIPDGMISGGPDDNSFLAVYSDWLAVCNFTFEEIELEVYTPYTEVLADYQACLANMLAGAQEKLVGGTTSFSSPVQSGLLRDDNDWSCGSLPIPPASLNQTYRVRMPAVVSGAVSGSTGSITYSVYTYEAKGEESCYTYEPHAPPVCVDNKAGAVNVVFYGNGHVGKAIDKLYSGSHWKTTDHHGFRCGAARFAYVWDSSHVGGRDKWYESTRQSEAHHSNSGAYHCDNAREHIRHYGDTSLNDDHSPSFGDYSIANVHHDDHNHNNPNSADGLAHLKADARSAGLTVSQFYSSSSGAYILHVRIP